MATANHGSVVPSPTKVLRARLYRGVWQVLIQWEGLVASDASWEDVEAFKCLYIVFQLEDELFIDRRRDVM